MKYLSLFLTILFLSLIWACTNEENLESSVGQFEGSNQISDCSGNSNLPEGCECFQTNCENQYDF